MPSLLAIADIDSGRAGAANPIGHLPAKLEDPVLVVRPEPRLDRPNSYAVSTA